MPAKVTVYTMDYCPYCERAKALLKQRNIPFEEVRVAEDDDKQWEALHQRSGMRTMPQIFAGERLIGGFSELSQEDARDQLASLRG
jgi:glutaredoxin 3